ncbi:hypothetical protein [Pedobacter cryotolerans]|uniref:Uncharacterized protein n=1 Tax=Pedobacter cryotolerans TaxID=2571270 RepID=A0A4V6WN02_9SPHI|nr:hypothetical protein [Pedobacter cryotolerans]TKC01767.1 hypothetical protein FA045_05815 [Pedobacter cryotolerans]
MKEKIQGILGMLIIGVFIFAIGASIYRSNFSEPEFEVLKSTKISAPIKNALFWHEEELEKTSDVMVGAKLGLERTDFIEPLYHALKTTGLVNEEIKTMSDDATKRMIELDAYRGTEPDVWEIAKQNGKAYIFKTTITNVSSRKGTSDLKSVTYLFTLYDVTTKSTIWEAKTWRSAGFFGGMPKGEETITIIENKLKEAKII